MGTERRRPPRKKKDNRWIDIDGGAAFLIPYTLLRHENFIRLSPFAHKLLMDVARQFTGFNNGYLCCSWTLMAKTGWRSEATVRNAMLELEHYGILERTRQGGKNCSNLHALTWRRIDEKEGKRIDAPPTDVPSNAWKLERQAFTRTTGKRKVGKPRLTLVKTVQN